MFVSHVHLSVWLCDPGGTTVMFGQPYHPDLSRTMVTRAVPFVRLLSGYLVDVAVI